MGSLKLHKLQDEGPMDFDQWLLRYPLRVRTVIKRDFESCRGMARAEDLRVKAFTKIELGSYTDPRNISGRTMAYQASLGPYIAAVEQHLSKLPWLVKHLDLQQRNEKLTKLYAKHSPQFFIEGDFSRFDATISEILIKNEHRVYHACFPNMDPLAAEFLAAQWRTKAYHGAGVRYTTVGRRCSGDPNTSIGNAIINRFCHWLAWRHLSGWVSIHEGDDGFAMIQGDPSLFSLALERSARSLGLEVKCLVHSDIAAVGFCGRRLYIEDDNTIKCYCDFNRTFPKLGGSVCPDLVSDLRPAIRAELCLSKALSYYHTDRDTPIIGALCGSLARLLLKRQTKWRADRDLNTRMIRYKQGRTSVLSSLRRPSSPSMACRLAFMDHTGIPPQHQIYFEQWYLGNIIVEIPSQFPLVPLHHVDDEFPVDTNKYYMV
nr:MAG: RNA-dependent RNA polymerase [Chemarfal virus 41]